HGAMMLAYLRDPRAEDAGLALEASTPSAERQRQRIVRAAALAYACSIRPLDGGYDVCIQNDGPTTLRGAMIQQLRDGATVGVATAIESEIAQGKGERVTVRHSLPPDLEELIVR